MRVFDRGFRRASSNLCAANMSNGVVPWLASISAARMFRALPRSADADNVQHPHESLFVTGVQRLPTGPEMDAATGDPQKLTELLPSQTGDST